MKVVELVLRSDMSDSPGCEERLERIVQYAVQHETPRFSWKRNLKSLGSLRNPGKGDGYKWANIEDSMSQEADHNRNGRNGRGKSVYVSPDGDHIDKLLAETAAQRAREESQQ